MARSGLLPMTVGPHWSYSARPGPAVTCTGLDADAVQARMIRLVRTTTLNMAKMPMFMSLLQARHAGNHLQLVQLIVQAEAQK